MSDQKQTTLGPHPHKTYRATNGATVIELWGLDKITGECPICTKVRVLDHVCGWFCGPVDQAPGERVPGWSIEAIAGGMSICQPCHDEFYGEASNAE